MSKMIEPLELLLGKGNGKITVDMHDIFCTVEFAYRSWIKDHDCGKRSAEGLIFEHLPEELKWEYTNSKQLRDLLHSILQNAMDYDEQFPDYKAGKRDSIKDAQGNDLGSFDLGLLERLNDEYVDLGVPFSSDDEEPPSDDGEEDE